MVEPLDRDAHAVGGDLHGRWQAFAQLAAKFFHADLTLAGDLRQGEEDAIRVGHAETHRGRSLRDTQEDVASGFALECGALRGGSQFGVTLSSPE